MLRKSWDDISKEELTDVILSLTKENEKLKKSVQKHYIYKLYFIEEPEKVYIGRTRNPVKRLIRHKTEFKQKKHRNTEIVEMFERYGTESARLEVIHEEYGNIDEINEVEEKIINEYKNRYKVINRVHNETFQGGRPKLEYDENFDKAYNEWYNRRVTLKEALAIAGISDRRFYNRVREIQGITNGERRVQRCPK